MSRNPPPGVDQSTIDFLEAVTAKPPATLDDIAKGVSGVKSWLSVIAVLLFLILLRLVGLL